MTLEKESLDSFLTFLNSSPTAYHAVNEFRALLLERQFCELEEGSSWNLESGKGYFTCRNGSTIAAFITPEKEINGCAILAAHTDSPGLKLKPNANYSVENMAMLAVELYGAPLLNSWLNRDLAIAGRIAYLDSDGQRRTSLVNLDDAPITIPQLAIHLDRSLNESGLRINKQEHMTPLAGLHESDPLSRTTLEGQLRKKYSFSKLLSHDLFLYPLEPARYVGFDQQMIAAYRLDNLCSAYAAVSALAASAVSSKLAVTLLWDNEEVGSETRQGAASTFLPHLLERIVIGLGMGREEYLRLHYRSLCISIDMAHALHPNYIDKHDPLHRPLLNKGVVIKHNAQQRYASDALSTASIVEKCEALNLPLQSFVSRNDLPCGSTIGPIAAALTGIATVDIGIPQLSMHSCRELCGSSDLKQLIVLLKALLQ